MISLDDVRCVCVCVKKHAIAESSRTAVAIILWSVAPLIIPVIKLTNLLGFDLKLFSVPPFHSVWYVSLLVMLVCIWFVLFTEHDFLDICIQGNLVVGFDTGCCMHNSQFPSSITITQITHSLTLTICMNVQTHMHAELRWLNKVTQHPHSFLHAPHSTHSHTYTHTLSFTHALL